MTKTRVLSLAALLAALLFLLTLPASAQCDPQTDPSCRLSPLQSRQVNPAASAAEGETTDLSAPGVPAAAAVEMPLITAESLSGVGASVASSEHRAPSGQQQARSSALGTSAVASAAPSIEALNLRMRYQDPSDVSCGVQALGMALDGLRAEGLEAPSSSALVGFLQNQSMMYDFGTGVEELAYAAGSFGFKGSQPFHGWSLADLLAELVGGRPVVVALGSNGEGVPGHFVTVTGLSDDGKWVSYNDPTLGKVTQSVDDFEALWAAQGHSGVSVRSPAALPAGTPDNLPLLALLAGVMALVSTSPLGKFRLGVGGKVIHSGSGANSNAPPYPAPAGKRWRAKTVPVYDTKTVQEGWTTVSHRVPIKKSVREQIGTRTYYEKIPQFKTIRVRDGYRWVAHKVPKYKTVRYVRYYRYRTQRRPTPWGWSYYRKRVPVYGSRRVRVGTKTKWRKVPKYTTKEVPSGYRTIERTKPVYDWVEKVVGYETVEKRVPRMVDKQVQVGTRTEWELEEAPIPPAPPPEIPIPTETPTPPASSATPSPNQTLPEAIPVQTPDPEGTPEPFTFRNERFLPASAEVASWLASDGKKYFGFARSGYKAYGVLGAAQELTVDEVGGTLRIFGPRSARDSLNWQRMTNWLRPENESQLHLSPASAARKSITSGGLALGLGLNIGADTIKFMNGEYDRFEYAAALTVDTGFSIGVAAAAGAFAGLVSGFVAGAVGGSVTVPGIGTVSGAVVGGVAGAIAGIVLGIGASITFNSNDRKDNTVAAVADLYRSWVGVENVQSASSTATSVP